MELVNVECFDQDTLHILLAKKLSLNFPVYDVEQFEFFILIRVRGWRWVGQQIVLLHYSLDYCIKADYYMMQVFVLVLASHSL